MHRFYFCSVKKYKTSCKYINIIHIIIFVASICFSRITYRIDIFILVIGPSILTYIFIENQQMHQNDHFIVMSSQTLLHVSAYQRHHQGAHTILTSYLYISVHHRKNNGISSKIVPLGIVTLWIHFGPCSTTVHCFQQRLAIPTCVHSVTLPSGTILLDIPLFFLWCTPIYK
jgi:hypothetical protein